MLPVVPVLLVTVVCILLGLMQQQHDPGAAKRAELRYSLKAYCYSNNWTHNRSISQSLHTILETFGLDVENIYGNVSKQVERFKGSSGGSHCYCIEVGGVNNLITFLVLLLFWSPSRVQHQVCVSLFIDADPIVEILDTFTFFFLFLVNDVSK